MGGRHHKVQLVPTGRYWFQGPTGDTHKGGDSNNGPKRDAPSENTHNAGHTRCKKLEWEGGLCVLYAHLHGLGWEIKFFREHRKSCRPIGGTPPQERRESEGSFDPGPPVALVRWTRVCVGWSTPSHSPPSLAVETQMRSQCIPFFWSMTSEIVASPSIIG